MNTRVPQSTWITPRKQKGINSIILGLTYCLLSELIFFAKDQRKVIAQSLKDADGAKINLLLHLAKEIV